MILELSGKFPVNMLCEEMGINRSSFYYWKEHLSNPAVRTKSLVSNIVLFQEYHLKFPSHGYRWLNAKIRLDTGQIMSDPYAHKCCKIAGIKSKAKHYKYNVPPEHLYESRSISEALARLEHAADNQQFAVVTSQPGCGKSTLIRKFASMLPPQKYLVLYLSDSKLTPRWFYKGLLDQLGIDAKFYRGDAKRQLQKEIEIIRGVRQQKAVCILDEAHLLERETIEEFRFMLNYRFDSESPMALVLAGQAELWDKLRQQRYAAVKQRIDLVCTLNPLDRAETARYIQSHLEYAGGKTEIFTDRALDAIHESSSGIPRMINRVCEKSLMYAFQQGKRLIDEHIVFYVVEHELLESSIPHGERSR